MDDQTLVTLSNEVDKTLHTLCGKYDIGALSLTGVILARLKIIAEAGEITDEFNKLLTHVTETRMLPRKFTVQ
jgi:hypothetical protein